MDGGEDILTTFVQSIRTFLLSIRRRLQLFIRLLDPRAIFLPSQLPEVVTQNAEPRVFSSYHLDPPLLVLGFCFTAACMAMQRVQNLKELPIAFHLICLAMVLSFAAICLSIYLSRNLEVQRQVLQHVGVLFGAIGFFLGITISFPLCLKLTAWLICALSLLWVLISHRV